MNTKIKFASVAIILLLALMVVGLGILSPVTSAQTKMNRVAAKAQPPQISRGEAGAQSQASQSDPNGMWVMDGRAKGGLSTEATSPLVPTLASPLTRAWTAAGSTGTIDEDSAAIAEVKNFTVTLKAVATGTVTTRLNITGTEGASSFCPATSLMLKLRYRQSDPSGATAKVTFELHQTNISTGGNTVIVPTPSGFSSGTSFFTVSGNFGVDLDFANNIYWIEITCFRSNAAQFADFGSVQIWEAAGTACP